jgi:glycosyltransferase involved in cell wall biosynthesis
LIYRNEKPVRVHISNWHAKWIIGGIFRESAEACLIAPSWQVYPTSKKDFLNPRVWFSRLNPQFGRLNIYAHQDTFFSIHAATPDLVERIRNRVFVTHFNEGQSLSEEQIRALRYCERILVQNKAMENFLLSRGISKDSIVRAPGAVNRSVYNPSTELPETKYVLFSGDFKYRKNPDLIARVIASMPDINFIVHGKNWEIFPPQFLNGLSNLKRIDFDLMNQPHLIRQASLYVSLALIEGGPYPVLEALASGTPVVATDTGFCAEFVNATNGILLPNSAELESVIPAIRQALNLKAQVWDQDLLFGKWQWKDLGSLIFN